MKTINDLSSEIRAKLAEIRLLIMDVDGVLTDGLINLDDNGIETKSFSTRDGLALFWMKRFGLKTGVISGRKSAATQIRCEDLHLDEIHLGTMYKTPVFEEILARMGIPASAVAYIGDDIIDLCLLKRAGVSAAPADAHPEVLSQVDIVLDLPGGHGAVRHFLDLWLAATGQWDKAMEEILHGNF
ncbi:MAG: KdsC family phosphatase [Calditrichota bacterium]